MVPAKKRNENESENKKKDKAAAEYKSLTLIDQPAKTPLPLNIRQHNYHQCSPMQLTDALITHYSTPAKFGFCN